MDAGIDIRTHQPEQEAHDNHAHGMQQGTLGQHYGGHQSEDHERKIIRRAEFQCDFGKGRRKQGDEEGRNRTGKKGTDGCRGEGHTGPALTRHLITVERRNHRCRFARDIHQNRGSGTTVLRAIINARQHNQGGNGRQDKGNREQHGNRGRGSKPGQNADQGAEKNTGQTVQQVGARGCRLKT